MTAVDLTLPDSRAVIKLWYMHTSLSCILGLDNNSVENANLEIKYSCQRFVYCV